MTSKLTSLLAGTSGYPALHPIPREVLAPKTSAAYQVHSYPTKIAPEAIVPFIEASSTEGAAVLDPFCGSGMTGVAALMANRNAVLSDLSVGAVHVAQGHLAPISGDKLLLSLSQLDRDWMLAREEALYQASCPTCGGHGVTRHVVWSEVHACDRCGADILLWEEADQRGQIPRRVSCSCGHTQSRSGHRPKRSVPVELAVACSEGCRTLQRGPVTLSHLYQLHEVEQEPVSYWTPDVLIDPSSEMYVRCALHLKSANSVADFYMHRARLALSELWSRISEAPSSVRKGLQFAFTNTAWHASRMRRFNAVGGQRPLTGTLYIPQLVAEPNVFEVFRNQVRRAAGYYLTRPTPSGPRVHVRRSTATNLSWLDDECIDYIFTDPPFGSNIFYADCNLVWEAWLGQTTEASDEIVVNRSRRRTDGGKSVGDYERLLGAAFREMRRVLKPGARASVVFHNSDDQVWAALLNAAENAGLRQTDVSLLDKVQRSQKGYKGRAGTELVPFYDLVITFSKGSVPTARLNGAAAVAADAVRSHLSAMDEIGAHADTKERSIEYLYSVAVSEVIRRGTAPDGLSFRAFEALVGSQFSRSGRYYSSVRD